MTFEEEDLARNLHRELEARCPEGTTVHLHGRETEWRCTASRGHRTGVIHCLYRRGESPGPEYRVTFQQNERREAIGLTVANEEAISATIVWLDGFPISVLHTYFAFVDGEQRALVELEKALMAGVPESGEKGTHELRNVVNEKYYLLFRAGERSCRIHYQGRNPQPDAIFAWHETIIFHFTMRNTEEFAHLIKAWLYEGATPFSLRAIFPWIELGIAAENMEAEHSLEGQLFVSWERAANYYKRQGTPLAAQILALVTEIRRAGYDRKLMVDDATKRILLLRPSPADDQPGPQPRVVFQFEDGVMRVMRRGWDTFKTWELQFTPRVDALLQELVARRID